MTTEYERILAGLREDWPKQQIFYTDDVAVILGNNTAKAITRMRERGVLDLAWHRLSHRYYCKLHDLATFLAGLSLPPKPKPGRPLKLKTVKKVEARRPALGPLCIAMRKYIAGISGQQSSPAFWEEVLGLLEKQRQGLQHRQHPGP